MTQTSFPGKRKILNDPVYGFIVIPTGIIYEIIEHPYFQRLRRIKQLGLTHLVYPGALHTRFHHAIGAMFLMQQAIDTLRSKGHEITDQEAEAVMVAILLHDIGHGPFSHALEKSIVNGVTHEDISGFFINRLNEIFGGRLELALKIFRNQYHKKFLYQLVSSQLDVDRLDYLTRDSFFTGVSEGVIGTERIIKMLNVVGDSLVVEAKGIYSIEKFIISRRLMYWQVYFHKTVLSAEHLLVKILQRAKFLAGQNVELFGTPWIKEFLYNDYGKNDFVKNPELLNYFANLDDLDITTSIKVWMHHDDKILSALCKMMIERKLYGVKVQQEPFDHQLIERLKKNVSQHYDLSTEEIGYFVITGKISNYAYNEGADQISVYFNEGEIKDIAYASDNLNVLILSKPVVKNFICFPKECMIV